MAADTIYSVPEQYAGKSIHQLAQGGFDPNVNMSGEELARQLGVGWDTPLQAGQTFTTDWNDTGHGDYSLLKYFTQTPASDYYASQAQKQMNEAIAPAISSLEASKPITQQLYAQQAENLKATSSNVEKRYDALLAQLTGEEKRSEADIGLATSREFGKRGVPLSSGIYDQALLEKYIPLREYYSGLGQQTGIAREADLMKLAQALSMNPIELAQQLNAIQQAIATVQVGGSKDAITNAFNQQQLAQKMQTDQAALENSLKIAQLEDPLRQAQAKYYNSQSITTAGDKTGLPVVA
jgi:hypothetical protein